MLALFALIGAWLDVVSRRLPNWLCLALALAGLALAAASGGAGALVSPAIHAAIALVAGLVLFGFGWIGGGDAKFYAACAAWFPLRSGFYLIATISFAGLVVVTAWLAYRRATGRKTRRDEEAFASVPYGVAIAIGAVALKALAP